MLGRLVKRVKNNVRAIVPAFAWDRTSEGTKRSIQWRAAHISRPAVVHLRDGEMLGVIVLADPSILPDFSNPITEGITLMGRAPLSTSPPSPITAGPANFANEVTNVYLAEHPNDPFVFAMLGFDVAFDKAGRCFCDIDVVTPSYFTFMRLALVRYQSHSVPRLAMSPLVMADFAQVAPECNIAVV